MSILRRYWLTIVSILVSAVVFLVPFAFILLTALKGKQQANLLDFSWPQGIYLWENIERWSPPATGCC